ncbi:MAG: hypothetical protein FD174_3157 [Geobacteraceae bacterium]|nr:MAG: hypothetical protein FD174_3157 [Geobacteraceae bacterium]
MENRKFERVGFHTEAVIKYGELSFNGEVENLSLKGLFVKTDRKIEIDEPVEITVFFHGTDAQLSFSLQAKVVRVTENGIGFNFQKIDIDSLLLSKGDNVSSGENPEQVTSKFCDAIKQGAISG